MRYTYPQSIILDVKVNSREYINDYWILNYSSSFSTKKYFSTTLSLISWYQVSNTSIISKESLSTVSISKPLSLTHSLHKSSASSLSRRRVINAKLKFLKTNSSPTLSQRKLSIWSDKSQITKEGSKQVPLQTNLYSLFDINFLKKERLYTKLKYSRSPAYDIVSGGSAALLAGFIGFLISEKFGIELVDSGDFYIGFMYAVFASFSVRPLLKILSASETVWGVLSFNFLLDYLYTLFYLSSCFFKKVLNRGKSFTNLLDKVNLYIIFFTLLIILFL